MATKRKKGGDAPRPARLILANGEKLVGKVPKTTNFNPPPLPRDYSAAREHLAPQIQASLRALIDSPAHLVRKEDLVMCLRLHPDMLAKTYDPTALFRRIPALRNAGSRRWNAELSSVYPTKKVEALLEKKATIGESRMIFIQSSPNGFHQLLHELQENEKNLTQAFKSDICKIERFDLLAPTERLHFDPEWRKGQVELVFHPTSTEWDSDIQFLSELAESCDVDPDKLTIRPYSEGPTFVSLFADIDQVKTLAACNLLRAAHPLRGITPPVTRSNKSFHIPPPPASGEKSLIKVGMFDGGVDISAPHLAGYAEEDVNLSCAQPPHPDFIYHGTAVAGAMLYGSLENHPAGTPLPTPSVTVVSVRVFPSSSPEDLDLYEAIDLIEAAVPARGDIETWNLSMGPPGPISDDPLSRFTWAIDNLSLKYRVTFVTAVGNDGDLTGNLGRIQSPADSVHGIAVGAYHLNGTQPARAEYSCKGPGREGGKVKPDFLCYGGGNIRPFQLLQSDGTGTYEVGTSFAAPLASAIHGELRGRFAQAQPLLARVLMVHAAKHPTDTHCHEFGFGILPSSIDDILEYPGESVTIAYQGAIETSAYHRLSIPIPETSEINGSVNIRFTLGAFSPLDINHLGDYTTCCIQDNFAPNANLYEFYPPRGVKANSKTLHLIRDAAEVAGLKAQRWKQAQLPKSKSPAVKNEEQLRTKDLKWDTLVRRSWNLQSGTSLYQPSVILHAMHRRDKIASVEYAAAVTIRAKKYAGDLHSEIQARYPMLTPVKIRSQAEVRISL